MNDDEDPRPPGKKAHFTPTSHRRIISTHYRSTEGSNPSIETGQVQSGNTYTLDVDRDGDTVNRIYFPKGGGVDFPSCELDSDGTGDCEDEQGRQWSFEGEGAGVVDSAVEEESEEDEGDTNDSMSTPHEQESDDADADEE